MNWRTMLAYVTGSVDDVEGVHSCSHGRAGGEDLFTTEVWTKCGLTTYYVLFFIRVATRRVHIVGVTTNPNDAWMTQVARNVTMADMGFLADSRHSIHDRDSKYSASFDDTIKATGVKPVKLPARSPNLNAFAGRWVLSVKTGCLSKLILFGEASLHRALNSYVEPIRCDEGLGGLLNFSRREAA